VKAIKTIYGSNLVPTSSSNIEMAVDVPEAEEVTFTLVSNKKHKEKRKVSSLSSMSSSDSKNKTSLISWASSLPKDVTAHPASKLVITHYGLAITVTPSLPIVHQAPDSIFSCSLDL